MNLVSPSAHPLRHADRPDGALLVSTFIPFEGTDGEDSTAVSVGEMITKVQAMRQAMNQERKADAARQGVEPDLVPQCEHLWVVSGVSSRVSAPFHRN